MVRVNNRRVQAQRKFAQGAHILPQASQPEKKQEVAPPPQARIVHTGFSVSELLDHVALSIPYNHTKDAVVVLNKIDGLTPSSNDTEKKQQVPRNQLVATNGTKDSVTNGLMTNKPSTSGTKFSGVLTNLSVKCSPISASSTQTFNESNTSNKINQNIPPTSSKDNAIPMSLRPRGQRKPAMVTKDNLMSPRKNKAKRKTSNPIDTLSKRRRSESSTDLEDNKPLSYLFNKKSPASAEKRVSEGTSLRTPLIEVERISLNDLQEQLSDKQKDKKIVQKTQPTQKSAIKKSTKRQLLEATIKITNLNSYNKTDEPASNVRVQNVKDQSELDGGAIGKLNESAIPKRITRRASLSCSAVTDIPIDDEKESRRSNICGSESVSDRKVSASHNLKTKTSAKFYNDLSIEDWLRRSQALQQKIAEEKTASNKFSFKEDTEASSSFKVPELPRRREGRMSTSVMPADCKRKNSCPVWRCKTMAAINKTSKDNLSYCGDCGRCSIISSIIALAKYLPKKGKMSIAIDESSVPAGPSTVSRSTAKTYKDLRTDNLYEIIEQCSDFEDFMLRLSSSTKTVTDNLNSKENIFGDMIPDTKHVISVIETMREKFESSIGNNGPDNTRIPFNKNMLLKVIDVLNNFKSKLMNELLEEPIKEAQVTEITPVPEVSQKAAPQRARSKRIANILEPSTHLPLLAPKKKQNDVTEAPTFYPTVEEMKDFIGYIQSIESDASKFGICKIVPPKDMKAPCVIKNVKFKNNNQYISNLYVRWGPVAKEMTAIKAYMATQNVKFTRPPLCEGIEVDLVKLYQLVQKHGGYTPVQRKWEVIGEEMKLTTGRIKINTLLDKVYCKHILPYEYLTHFDRHELLQKVEKMWQQRYDRMRERARKPLHRQRRMLGESDSSSDEQDSEDDQNMADAFVETEDCIVPGQLTDLKKFQKVAEQVRNMHFPNAGELTTEEIESEYWRLVLLGTEHVCVHSASLDTAVDGLGFPLNKEDGLYSWNLKTLGEDTRNVLSSLGPTMSVTVPTLHLGMMFTTNCWHMDPHHLPWTEYMHSGPPKIWYGIPHEQGGKFRRAVEELCPTAVQNKSIWLPSDITMIPPKLLRNNVSLSRLEQKPGEYVIVFPRAYSCSISTGMTISESLYFASGQWLKRIEQIFQDLRDNCEPSMFSMEHLLVGITKNELSSTAVLQQVHTVLVPLLLEEMRHRNEAKKRNIPLLSPQEYLAQNRRCSQSSWQLKKSDECDICRCTLFCSKMINVSTPRTSVCFNHGLRLVQRAEEKKEEIDPVGIIFLSKAAIDKIIKTLEKRIVE